MEPQLSRLFIAPLFKVSTDALHSDNTYDIHSFFFHDIPHIEESSLIGVEFTRNRNAVTLDFSDPKTAERARLAIMKKFPDITAKLVKSKTSQTDKSQHLPVPPNDPSIPSGLTIIPDWITRDEEALLSREIDSLPWDTTLRRRVQHYGFQFKYSQLNVDADARVRDFPNTVKQIIMTHEIIKSWGFDQLTINEYLPGVGIASHCDTHSAFTETIAVVSLLNPIVMDFVNHDNSIKVPVGIPPRSLMLMAGESRLGWRHSIASRKTDLSFEGTAQPRQRRVSLTFRKIVKVECQCRFPSLCDTQGADDLRPRRMQYG